MKMTSRAAKGKYQARPSRWRNLERSVQVLSVISCNDSGCKVKEIRSQVQSILQFFF